MLSKGGKIEYACPYCQSTDIKHVYIKPAWAALMRPVAGQFTDKEWEEGVRLDSNHGECNNCGHWFEWWQRFRRSLKNGRRSNKTNN